MPTPTPVPTPTPIPTPTPDPVASVCLPQSHTTVSGTQRDQYSPSVSSHLAVNAEGANWTAVDDWPVSVDGNGSLCWDGGTIAGTWGSSTPWETFHHTGGFSFANPDSVVENVPCPNYGDAINVRDGASNWRVRAAHTSMIHDDCLQDDYLNAGVIEDSLFDGCYVGISTRASSNNSSSDGHNNTLTMRNSLLRLQPMPTVYKGPAPGHGGFFKWDDDAHRSPKLALFGNVFRVDQEPNHGSLGLPDGYSVSCCEQHHRVARPRRVPRGGVVARQVPRHQDRDERVDVGHRGDALERGALGRPSARLRSCAPVWVSTPERNRREYRARAVPRA